MKKFAIHILLAILSFVIANYSFAASWRLIFKTNTAEIYIDQSSIPNAGTEKTILIKSNEVRGERSPSSLELKYLVNCATNEVALIGARQFKGLELQGDAITLSTSNPPKPIEAKPGTAAGAYLKAACIDQSTAKPINENRQNSQQVSRSDPATSNPTQVNPQIGRQLAICRGKFIVFAMTNYELNQVETANVMKEQQQEADRLSPKYISRVDYDQISASEIKRFSPMVRQNTGGGFSQASAEMLKCVEFIRDLKK